MNSFLSQLHKAKQSITWADSRQQALRSQLRAYMTANPAVPQRRFWHIHFTRFTYVSAAVLLIIVAGASTAAAANGSLPGNPLYVVKTHVNEPLRAAFITDADAKAAYEAQLAARRVEEANELAAQGKLNVRTETDLTENLDSHVRKVEDRVGRLKEANNEAAEAQERLGKARTLLKEARTKLRNREYNGAAELSRQAAESARGTNSGSRDRDQDQKDRSDYEVGEFKFRFER